MKVKSSKAQHRKGNDMEVLVVGAGKLANELLDALAGDSDSSDGVRVWPNVAEIEGSAIVVHAGSGRELDEVISYCRRTRSILVELATGSAILNRELQFPVVLCPNTNILMLKFMAMLAKGAHLFKDYKIELVESHQADKSSMPGTAVSLAQSLGVPSEDILSVRDPIEQREVLKIPPEHIARHAYHRIAIEDKLSSIILETRVFGPAPYAEGVARIISYQSSLIKLQLVD
jgi:4-hydroxy-tetrahydrodipicolinate reductase